jgi:hypothetical protein
MIETIVGAACVIAALWIISGNTVKNAKKIERKKQQDGNKV